VAFHAVLRANEVICSDTGTQRERTSLKCDGVTRHLEAVLGVEFIYRFTAAELASEKSINLPPGGRDCRSRPALSLGPTDVKIGHVNRSTLPLYHVLGPWVGTLV